MVVIRMETVVVLRNCSDQPLSLFYFQQFKGFTLRCRALVPHCGLRTEGSALAGYRCATSGGAGAKRPPGQLTLVQQLLQDSMKCSKWGWS
ncbi:hypothetical protein NL676_026980 [Syzygium grande]|nr:hypothetical protein NL676_026980 [Syzygium grande]